MTVHYASIDINRPPYLGGSQWMLRGLRDITVIFGRNGAGKSQLLRAIHQNSTYHGTFPTAPERGGEFAFDHNFAQQEMNVQNRGQTRASQNFAPNYRKESVSRVAALMTKIGFAAGTGNQTLTNDRILSEISERLTSLLPEFKFEAKAELPHFKLTRTNVPEGAEGNVGNPSVELSSGEMESLTIGLDLLTVCSLWELESQQERLLLIDEPDPHMHPELQTRFASFILELVNRYKVQVIIATHSTTLMSALGRVAFNRVGVLYLNNAQFEHKAHPFDKYLKKLSSVLGGHALVGPLFGAPLLLVEGDDDHRIWSHVPRQPEHKQIFAVLPCDGDEIKNYQPMLEQLFASLRNNTNKPAGYALIDGDKPKPTHGEYKNIPFIQLACREAENLYLTDDVLASIKLTWEDAKARIKAQASNYPKVEKKLSDCDNWEIRQNDLKDLIEPLSSILDDAGLHWTQRIGQTLGKRRPRGQLLDFLGDEVVDALWK